MGFVTVSAATKTMDYKSLITRIEGMTDLHPQLIRKVIDALSIACASELRNGAPIAIGDLGTLCVMEQVQHGRRMTKTQSYVLQPSNVTSKRLKSRNIILSVVK
ncbi:HU family DNA-binding protein [Metallibacterium scheffleri]|uniref:HU family DNA-binding protein n=1 Tax=Metallibacterium scheffleri TaxID=993689 RepID=UPI0024125282|nr:HU family DNA-binding protein [Metallibacterium scheffleri]